MRLKRKFPQSSSGLRTKKIIARIYYQGLSQLQTRRPHELPTFQGFLQPQLHGEYTIFEGQNKMFLHHHAYDKVACDAHAYGK